MSRCCACNELLTDSESVRKDSHGAYADMCDNCWGAVVSIVPELSTEYDELFDAYYVDYFEDYDDLVEDTALPENDIPF